MYIHYASAPDWGFDRPWSCVFHIFPVFFYSVLGAPIPLVSLLIRSCYTYHACAKKEHPKPGSGSISKVGEKMTMIITFRDCDNEYVFFLSLSVRLSFHVVCRCFRTHSSFFFLYYMYQCDGVNKVRTYGNLNSKRLIYGRSGISIWHIYFMKITISYNDIL